MKAVVLVLALVLSVTAYDITTKGLPAGVGDKAVDFKFNSDTTAPSIDDVQLVGAASVNASTSGVTVSWTVTSKDTGSGVSRVAIGFASPNGMIYQNTFCSNTGGPDNKDKYTCAITFSKWVQWGDYNLAWVNSTDVAGNINSITSPMTGWTTKVTIASVWDGTPPTLTSFTISPTTLTVGADGQHAQVQITAIATDARSGPYQMKVWYNYPGGASVYGTAVTGTTTLTATFNNGNDKTAQYSTKTKFTYPGDWTMDHVEIADQAGNIAKYSVDDLKNINKDLVTTISVTNTNPQGQIKEGAELVGVSFDRTSVDATVSGGTWLWTNVTFKTPSPIYESGSVTVSMKDENGDWIDIKLRLGSNAGQYDVTTVSGANTMLSSKVKYTDYLYKTGHYSVSGVGLQHTTKDSPDIFYTIYGKLSPSSDPNAAGALRPSVLLAAALAMLALFAFKQA